MRDRPFLICLMAAGGLPLLSVMLPQWGGIFLFFIPASYITLGYLLNLRPLIFIVGICSSPFLLYGFKNHNWNLVLVDAQLILTGLLIGYLLRKGLHPFKSIFFSVFFMAILEGLIFFIVLTQKGMGPGAVIDGFLDYQFRSGSGAFSNPEMAREYELSLSNLKAVIKQIYPSMVLIVGALIGLMNLALGQLLFAKSMKLNMVDYVRVFSWRPKHEAIWVLLASGFGTLLLDGAIRTFSLNLLLVSFCVYFFQGIGVIGWWMEKAKMAGWIRAIIFVSLGLQQIFMFLVSLLGILDNWADFRRIGDRVKGKEAG